MTRDLLRKFIETLSLLILLSICIFGLIRLAPGGPLAAAERNPNISPEQLTILRHKYGLDRSLFVQYITWVGQILRGDFGQSYKFYRPVSALIGERLPNTFILIGISLLITVSLSIFIGVYSATHHNSLIDRVLTIIVSVGQSMPLYWLSSILILIFYVSLKNPTTGGPLFPSSGMYSTGMENEILNRLWHLVLPVAALSFNWIAWYSRYVRASMLDVLETDYIVMARAKGLPNRLVIFRHAFPNAAIPLVTAIALDVPALFGGALFAEVVFAWPGIGRLFWDAARSRDYPVILAIVLVSSLLVIFSNLMADLIYLYLDPSIRFDKRVT